MKAPFIAIIPVLFFALSTMVANDGDPDVPKAESKLTRLIQGAWELRNDDGSRRLKLIVGGMWTITESDPETGKVVFHHGGSYTLNGDTYVEKVEFANESTADLVGAKHTFRVRGEGEKLTQIGVGNPWKEEWTRVRN